MITDIEIIKNCEPILRNKIILYGGGFYGNEAVNLLRKLEIPVEAICTTEKEDERRIRGIHYITVPELKDLDDKEELLIVVSTIINEFVEQIVENLDRYQITRGRRITYLGLQYACVLNRKIDRGGRLACEWEIWRMWYGNYRRSWGYETIWHGIFENAIWVYTTGKVGSTTLWQSIKEAGIPSVIVHELEKERLELGVSQCLDGKKWERMQCFGKYDLFLEQLKKQERIRIITMVREPIARDISRYFQGFRIPYPIWGDQTNDLYDDFIRMTEGFLKNDDQFEWFNKELKAVFDMDVYDYSFDQENGYTIIEKNNISVLVLKLEKLDNLEPVVRNFLQAEDFELINGNENTSKPYQYMYKEFKRNIKLPQSYINRYYKGNPYMDHFYSKEEQERFLQKWHKNILID